MIIFVGRFNITSSTVQTVKIEISLQLSSIQVDKMTINRGNFTNKGTFINKDY